MKPLALVLLPLVCAMASSPVRADRPSILVIMADDCTYNDLPLYGGVNAKTPHVDRLASQGLTFNRAYLAEAMCQPCRAELFTGQYPMRNGCAWNHSASRKGTRSVPHALKPLGYRVGLAGKKHVRPAPAFPFTPVGGFDPNCVRDPTADHDVRPALEFMKADGPFFLVVALVEPHVPWVMGDASAYPPGKITLPPNIADTKMTREVFGRYLAEITYMDGQVGDLLRALDDSGRADDTLVLFTSEQGSQFPGNKWTNWDTGVHTALVARWPGRVPAGKRTDALVQYADVLPTLVDLAGGDPAAHGFDGTSFRAVLEGRTETHRKYVYGVHNNIPEGPSYPVRTVSDGTYRYIRNLLPDEVYIEKHLMGVINTEKLERIYWASWVREAWDNPRTYALVRRFMNRPAEEFYHTAKDPYEMNSLADSADHAEIKARLSAELDRWMKAQGDPGVPQDTHKAHRAAKRGAHLFVPPDPR